MGRESTHRAPKKIIIVVKENPLDRAAANYIALFCEKAASDKRASFQKRKGKTDITV